MSKNQNLICATKGKESLLLIMPIEIANELEIQSHEMLKFEIQNGQLVIEKVNGSEHDPSYM
jgi:antitoxin component of MazEF toxin-antitoxin module